MKSKVTTLLVGVNHFLRSRGRAATLSCCVVFTIVTMFSWKVSGVSSFEETQLEQFGVSTLSGVQAVTLAVAIVSLDGPKPLSEEPLQTQVELALRMAGIRVVDKATAEKTPNAGLLCVDIVINKIDVHIQDQSRPLYAVVVQVTYRQGVRLFRNEKILTHIATWPWMLVPEPMVLGSDKLEEGIRSRVGKYVANFINDYIAANPHIHAQQMGLSKSVGPNSIETPAKDSVTGSTPPAIEGIGMSANNRFYVLINGRLVDEGNVVNGYRVHKIHADRVEFEKDGKVFIQNMN